MRTRTDPERPMSEPQTTYNERLPDLTPKEAAAVQQWARRVKAGQRAELFVDNEGRVCVQPVERGEVERA